eukprot:TRINITY_DN14301_c0_g1_i1.p1 TRINITY_DN14301_c0_g1~~TRINITY_DN14301_c0_g1_i1.p1  ORF type:complete len:229 (+),score=47.35 TRINITY_DN14301_c0_g1_i1:16-702(+)
MPSVEKYAKANIGLMVILLVVGGACFAFAYINALAAPRSRIRVSFAGVSAVWILAASIVGFIASGKKTRKLILAHFWMLFLLSVWILASYIAYIALVYNDTEGAKQDCINANINLYQCNTLRMRNHGIFGGISIIVLAGTLTFSVVSACWWRAAKYEQWDKIAEREEKKNLAINSDQVMKTTAAKKSESENNSEEEDNDSSSDSDSSEEEEEEEIDESARLESSKEMN